MEEKILLIIKAAVKNSTFSERSFSEAAKAISKAATLAGVTDENLEKYVTEILPVFTTFQGDANNQIAEAVKKAKPSKKEEDEPKAKDKQEDGKPLTAEAIAAIVAEANKPFVEKLEAFETSKKHSALIQDAKKQLMDQYKLKENLCDKVLGRIDINDESTVENLAKNALEEYNDLATEFGLQAVTGIPKSDNTPTPPEVKDIDAILDSM